MSEQSRLHHLLDRMRRGVLLPAEREQLAGLVGELEKRAERAERLAQTRAARIDAITTDRASLRQQLASQETETMRHHARVAELEARVALLEAGRDERSALLEEARDALEAAGINEAHGGESWPRLVPAIEELAADRDRLTAGQCTDSLAMCLQHHAVPVADCPYPRCVTARPATA